MCRSITLFVLLVFASSSGLWSQEESQPGSTSTILDIGNPPSQTPDQLFSDLDAQLTILEGSLQDSKSQITLLKQQLSELDKSNLDLKGSLLRLAQQNDILLFGGLVATGLAVVEGVFIVARSIRFK